MPVSEAWLLTFSDGLHAAVGNLELVHLLPDTPELVEIPENPDYCKYTVLWQNKRLPLVDFRLFFAGTANERKEPALKNKGLTGIVAFRSLENSRQEFGAVLLSRIPVRINVDDKQACGLPENGEKWNSIAISCFKDSKYGVIPILDLPRIFSAITM